jgi:DNA transformation protein and related proteins
MASTRDETLARRAASQSPQGLAAHCAELLAPLGPVRVRRMFGGHGLYLDELFIAIVTGETLYLKTDATTADAFRAAGGRPFQYEGAGRAVTVAYWTVPEAALDSPDGLRPWARLALEAALRARAAAAPKRPATKRPAASRSKRAKAQAAR